MQKTFYFIRHGEADFSSFSLHDEPDVPLTSRGRNQALSMQPIIEALSIQTICVSPLSRALETKDLISQNLSCKTIVVEELRECSGVIWKKMVELEENPSIEYCPTVQHFLERTILGIKRSLMHPGPVLIVAHGGIHWGMCHYLNVRQHERKIGNCIPVHFYFSEDQQWEAKILGRPND